MRPGLLLIRDQTERPAVAGFTLIELLIAFAILGLITLMSLGSLQFGTRVWERTTADSEADGRVRAVQHLIRRQLGRIFEQKQLFLGAPGKGDLQGARGGIEFIAPFPSGDDTGGLYRQRLAVASTTAGNSLVLTLQALDTEKAGASNGQQTVSLLSDVVELRFAFLASARGNDAPVWRDTWDEATLPLLVRLNIAFAPDAIGEWPELIVAPRPVLP